MLKITIPSVDFWDDASQVFISEPEVILELEHSLVSLSKWESIFEKPFLGKEGKTNEEALGYVEAMILGEIPPKILTRLSQDNVNEINAYIDRKMTATWFPDSNQRPGTQVVTSELIYSWMIALEIPFECQNWHLKRLLTLIEVRNRQNQPAKKPGKPNMDARRALNEARRKQAGTAG